MTALAGMRRDTFAALSNANFRRYFVGQSVSMAGTWMQAVAQSWLVLQLTGSGTALGSVIALQTLPVLLFAPYGGLLADRLDKRRLMIGLQSTMGLLAALLGLLTVTGSVELWHVYAIAFLLGLNNSIESPARQAFVLEIVGSDDLRNAVSLNSVLVNAARAVGPAIAGAVIAAGGLGVCFLLNALSFVAVVVSLIRLDIADLCPSPPAAREPGQLREGLRYVARNPDLLVPLLMMALVGCLTYEFQVVLPVLARDTFGGDASVYGFMTAAMGLGAVAGGLVVAARGRTGIPSLVVASILFGLVVGAAAIAPTRWLAYAALVLVGAASVSFMAIGNSTLQLAADPRMRGRVMALWSVAFLGSTPIGGPILGVVVQQFGGRTGLALGAAACLVAAALGGVVARHRRTRSAPSGELVGDRAQRVEVRHLERQRRHPDDRHVRVGRGEPPEQPQLAPRCHRTMRVHPEHRGGQVVRRIRRLRPLQ